MLFLKNIVSSAAVVAALAVGASANDNSTTSGGNATDTNSSSSSSSSNTAETTIPATPLVTPSSDCHDYHIFSVRGSNEPYPGRMGKLIHALCQELGSSCGYEDVKYPANASTDGPGIWCESANKGAVNGQAQLRQYADRCGDARLVILGYSQGGSVVGDILGGGGGPVFDCVTPVTPPLKRTESPGNRIVAAATWGSVRHTANQTYNRGEASVFDGISPRPSEQLEALHQFDGVFAEWCNTSDFICGVGQETQEATQHWNYFDGNNTDLAREWIVDLAKNGPPQQSTEGGSGNGGGDGAKGGEDESAAVGRNGVAVWGSLLVTLSSMAIFVL